MMRALWTAASGMKAMQFNVDTISNNLANVNTTGYKKKRLNLKIFCMLQCKMHIQPKMQRPVNLQVGHGVVARATSRDFSSGNLEQTNNKLDMAIEGVGFLL